MLQIQYKNYNKGFTSLLFLFLSYIASYAQNSGTSDSDIIKRISDVIRILSADSLQGREAGTVYELKAAAFIENSFKTIGLSPIIDGGYLHEFPFVDGINYKDSSFLILNNKKFEVNNDFHPLNSGINASIEGNIVRAGLGLIDDKKGINDFQKNIAENPVFVVELSMNPDSSVFEDYILELSKRAKENKGNALIIINTTKELNNPEFNPKKYNPTSEIPIVFVKGLALKVILDATLPKIQMRIHIQQNMKKGYNVVGYIDNKAKNTIVLGAHYDHLGLGMFSSRYTGKDKLIHNGADDNASGVAGLIALASIIHGNKSFENYNYIFIAFSAEEKGLFGSTAFAKSQYVKSETINCMLNMDMIGRIDSTKKTLYILGTGTSPSWDTLLNKVYTPDSLVLSFVKSGVGGSDHTPFYMQNIPVLFFFTGMHQDYHMPDDDFEKINIQGEVAVVQYIKQLVLLLNEKGKLNFTKAESNMGERQRIKGVTLGIMPDHTFTGTGIKINSVSEGKAAQQAGLQAGDIILKIGDYEIKEIYSYMNALSKFKAGETVELKYLRIGKEEIINIKF